MCSLFRGTARTARACAGSDWKDSWKGAGNPHYHLPRPARDPAVAGCGAIGSGCSSPWGSSAALAGAAARRTLVAGTGPPACSWDVQSASWRVWCAWNCYNVCKYTDLSLPCAYIVPSTRGLAGRYCCAAPGNVPSGAHRTENFGAARHCKAALRDAGCDVQRWVMYVYMG